MGRPGASEAALTLAGAMCGYLRIPVFHGAISHCIRQILETNPAYSIPHRHYSLSISRLQATARHVQQQYMLQRPHFTVVVMEFRFRQRDGMAMRNCHHHHHHHLRHDKGESVFCPKCPSGTHLLIKLQTRQTDTNTDMPLRLGTCSLRRESSCQRPR